MTTLASAVTALTKVDSYKLSHFRMYAAGLNHVESNYTNRKSRIDGINHVVNFGVQAWLTDLQKDWEEFFKADRESVVEEYRNVIKTFVSEDFTYDHIRDLHDLGYLPIRVSSHLEGTLVPIRVPSVLIESTHGTKFAWLVNYLETNLSASIWHPSTTATIAWDLHRDLVRDARKSGEDPESLAFSLHDFSYRGMVNWQAAAASGAAHLLSFLGSDVVPTVQYVNTYYPGDNGLIAASVPATEHSVMCTNGEQSEQETVETHMEEFPTGILSEVVDTWDYFRFITVTLPKLKEKILARDGKLVIRPDSGDPADIICGTVDLPLPPLGEHDVVTPEMKGSIELLWDLFGGHKNESGLKVLHPKIGLIYGDGITKSRIKDINERLLAKGFASTNWVAGVGSYSYQMVTRDTFGSAVKATYVEVDGVGRNIQKDPATDDGTKKSATGRLAALNMHNGNIYLIEGATDEQRAKSLLKPVWENGKFLRTQSFSEVRAQLKRSTEILERNGSI